MWRVLNPQGFPGIRAQQRQCNNPLSPGQHCAQGSPIPTARRIRPSSLQWPGMLWWLFCTWQPSAVSTRALCIYRDQHLQRSASGSICQDPNITCDELAGTMGQTPCSFRDYYIPAPVAGCGQTGPKSLDGCEFELCNMPLQILVPHFACVPVSDVSLQFLAGILIFHPVPAGLFCVQAYDQSTPLLSCGPALDELGDHIPCGEGRACKAGQVCPEFPCPPLCHTLCSTGCLSP